MSTRFGVHHVAVRVPDIDRSFHFYCDVVGLSVLRTHLDEQEKVRAVWFSLANGAFLAIERAEVASEPVLQAHGYCCLALTIQQSDRSFWMKHFETHNIAIVKQTSYTFYIQDPDGNTIGFSHYPDET